MRYSVLTFIVNDYEPVREIQVKHDDVEYVLVTDNPNLKSETWTVKVVENPHPEDPFWLCYYIRHHPWEYVSSDVVVKIDGSMHICGDIDPIVDKFNDGGYNIGVLIHPWRNTIPEEYETWIRQRKYPLLQALKCLSFVAGYPISTIEKYRHLCQYNLMIQRKDKWNNTLNRTTFSTLEFLAEEGKYVERIDQIIGSNLLNIMRDRFNVMPMDVEVCTSGKYFQWYRHGSLRTVLVNNPIDTYLFNEKIKTIDL